VSDLSSPAPTTTPRWRSGERTHIVTELVGQGGDRAAQAAHLATAGAEAMGTWGPGGFENDAALDFVAEIQSAQDLADALTVRSPDESIDADTACRIVVVAECVAAMRGHPSDDMPDGLTEKLLTFGRPSRSLFHHARDHLSAVMIRSELMELWAEGDPGPFNLAMHDLLERLNLPPADPSKLERPKKKQKPVINRSPCAFCDKPMGENQFSQFAITLDHGDGNPMTHGGWAHHRCLNAALHPKHMIRVYVNDEPIDPDELDRLLERPPTAED
jgi:hypothetical protein